MEWIDNDHIVKKVNKIQESFVNYGDQVNTGLTSIEAPGDEDSWFYGNASISKTKYGVDYLGQYNDQGSKGLAGGQLGYFYTMYKNNDFYGNPEIMSLFSQEELDGFPAQNCAKWCTENSDKCDAFIFKSQPYKCDIYKSPNNAYSLVNNQECNNNACRTYTLKSIQIISPQQPQPEQPKPQPEKPQPKPQPKPQGAPRPYFQADYYFGYGRSASTRASTVVDLTTTNPYEDTVDANGLSLSNGIEATATFTLTNGSFGNGNGNKTIVEIYGQDDKILLTYTLEGTNSPQKFTTPWKKGSETVSKVIYKNVV